MADTPRSEVAPRSSGGSPDERPEPDYWHVLNGFVVVATYDSEEGASREAARRNGNVGRDVYRIESCYTGQSYEALRTQVSALRQQLDDAEQEEAFLVRLSDSRDAELLAARQEAAALRIQLEEALLAHTRATTVGLQLAQDVTVARQEAETLRGQLDAAQKDRDALERELAAILPGSKHADRDAARVAAPREEPSNG